MTPTPETAGEAGNETGEAKTRTEPRTRPAHAARHIHLSASRVYPGQVTS